MRVILCDWCGCKVTGQGLFALTLDHILEDASSEIDLCGVCAASLQKCVAHAKALRSVTAPKEVPE